MILLNDSDGTYQMKNKYLLQIVHLNILILRTTEIIRCYYFQLHFSDA